MFKVGDRVRILINDHRGLFRVDELGVVTATVKDTVQHYQYVVKLDGPPRRPPTIANGFAIVDSFYFREDEITRV